VNEACDVAYQKGYSAALEHCNHNCKKCNSTAANIDLESVRENGLLFAQNLPYIKGKQSVLVQEEELRATFEQYGAITEIRVIPRGYAFVQYAVPENAVAALLELNNTMWQGRRLKVMLAHKKGGVHTEKDDVRKDVRKDDDEDTILFGSFQVDPSIVRDDASLERIEAEMLRLGDLRDETSSEISRLQNLFKGLKDSKTGISTTSRKALLEKAKNLSAPSSVKKRPSVPPTISLSTTSTKDDTGRPTVIKTDSKGRPVITLQSYLSETSTTSTTLTTSAASAASTASTASTARKAHPKTRDQLVYGKPIISKMLGKIIMTKQESKDYYNIFERIKNTREKLHHIKQHCPRTVQIVRGQKKLHGDIEVADREYQQAALEMVQLGKAIRNKKGYKKRKIDPNYQSVQKKLFLPIKEFPDINWIGVVIGKKGSRIKLYREKSGADVCVCGKGSRAKKSLGLADTAFNKNKSKKDSSNALLSPDTRDPHVLIKGETKAQVAKAEQLVQYYIDRETAKVKPKSQKKQQEVGRKKTTAEDE